MSLSTAKPIKDIGPIRGSTAQILVELYKRSMGFNEISSDDSVLKRCTAIDVETTRSYNQLASTTKLDQAQTDANYNIAQQRELDRRRTTPQAPLFNKDFEELQSKTINLKAQRDELLKLYRKLAMSQREQIADLILHKPKASITPAEIERILNSLEKEVRQFRIAVERYTKDKEMLEVNMSGLRDRSGQGIERPAGILQPPAPSKPTPTPDRSIPSAGEKPS